MAEVVHVFAEPLYLDGVPYMAQVVARPAGHVWEAWIEFASEDGSDVRRTPRETTQSDRAAVVYWATGLSGTYLEGALRRATEPPPHRRVEVMPEPFFSSPAPSPVTEVVAPDRAVLDPFSVASKGEELLRRELGALASWHLRNIVRAYDLADETLDLEQLTQSELIELIVGAVQPA
jgi:hypothetical protein